MYGTQDASNAWQKTWGGPLARQRLLKGFCHGDDFVIACPEEIAEAFGALLRKKFEVKLVLNRTVRLVDDNGAYLIEIEADQKHVPQLVLSATRGPWRYEFNTKGNAVKTPRVKLNAAEAAAVEDSPLLHSAQATAFRSGTMRAAYLGQDR
eukprot:3588705-Amphidinium_carterae.1